MSGGDYEGLWRAVLRIVKESPASARIDKRHRRYEQFLVSLHARTAQVGYAAALRILQNELAESHALVLEHEEEVIALRVALAKLTERLAAVERRARDESEALPTPATVADEGSAQAGVASAEENGT